MVVLIAGASHTGKTVLAQNLLQKYGFPYLSIDHLKMGLIRSGHTTLTPEDDEPLTAYLWPILRGIVKTAVENRQNLTVEGCYIPFDWEKDFDENYRKEIRCVFLIMTERYIRAHFSDIKNHANDIEARGGDSELDLKSLLSDNAETLRQCKMHGCEYLLIDDEYRVDLELQQKRLF